MSPLPTRKTKCEHTSPDLLHLSDVRKADDTFVRVFDCTVCGRYEIPLDVNDMEKYARLQLEFLGELIAIPEEKVAAVRDARRASSATDGRG